MLIIASYDIIQQLKDEKISMGLDTMLYPVGEFTQAIHGLNFAIRAALSCGGIQRGDREGLYNYLSKRPKVFVLQLGPLDYIKVAAEFAVMFNGSPTITDQDVEPIPDKYVVQKTLEEMITTAIEVRGCRIKLGAISLPVAYGPAFEGETIRRPDMYVEAGGPSKTLAFELLKMRPAEEVTAEGSRSSERTSTRYQRVRRPTSGYSSTSTARTCRRTSSPSAESGASGGRFSRSARFRPA